MQTLLLLLILCSILSYLFLEPVFCYHEDLDVPEIQ